MQIKRKTNGSINPKQMIQKFSGGIDYEDH